MLDGKSTEKSFGSSVHKCKAGSPIKLVQAANAPMPRSPRTSLLPRPRTSTCGARSEARSENGRAAAAAPLVRAAHPSHTSPAAPHTWSQCFPAAPSHHVPSHGQKRSVPVFDAPHVGRVLAGKLAIEHAYSSVLGSHSRYGRRLLVVVTSLSHTPVYPDPDPVPRPAVDATFVSKRAGVLAAAAPLRDPPCADDHADDWHV